MAFPLKQVSLDSVHEKNVRHGHISTLHIWPARRPLAASRAALLATLLPDPGDPEKRRELLRRMAGTVVETPNTRTGKRKEETHGGILHWGRERENATAQAGEGNELNALAAFRQEIKEAYGGRAPRVLDPFAGGGAIPLEAMRLGCETVASDLNPVAWFILRCTLHYPRLLAGQRQPLPDFALKDREFLEKFFKAQGLKGKRALNEALAQLGHGENRQAQLSGHKELAAETIEQADLAWHLRAWGRRVLLQARRELAQRYPTYADFEPLRRKRRSKTKALPTRHYQRRPLELLTPDANGEVSTDDLNAEFDSLYLEDETNPRWTAKPTVAYLWARTVRCGGCRAEIPLLKTLWLCKKGRKRVLLTLKSVAGKGVEFGLEQDVPEGNGNTAQRRQRDQNLGAGTMSRSGATCPSCGVIRTMKDIRADGRAAYIGKRMTAVVVDGQQGKEYRLPTKFEIEATHVISDALEELYDELPFGLPREATPKAGIGASRAFAVDGYGLNSWRKLFTDRQLLALGTLIRQIRRLPMDLGNYPGEWHEAITVYCTCAASKLADYSSTICSWHNSGEKLGHTFARFALPMVWDYCEVNPLAATTGGFLPCLEWVARVVEHLDPATKNAPQLQVLAQSATNPFPGTFDLICTDPPYYDAIPYSDLMDFFHIWLRRALRGLSPETDAAFAEPLGPKWNSEDNNGELIDDAGRFEGDRLASKRNYEDGMARAFSRFHEALADDGRLVLVFANKQPDAWETLVSALIRAGFVVDASWPIQTEMQTRQRSLSSAALSSSIWLVCKKRSAAASPGWDRAVLGEMQANIIQRLRDFWDAGVRGPDFVWAATGPALEAFSRHPVVRKADTPGEQLTVADFLIRVRRMVVGFVVSNLLARSDAAAEELDDPTTYYLLHRNDFGLDPAPAGACILYALSCNLADSDLAGRLDILSRGGKRSNPEDGDVDEDGTTASGSEARLKSWNRRRARDLGMPSANGKAPPLIDSIHKLMQLWKTGEQSRVESYLEDRGLIRQELFALVVQALIELAENGSEERATLESIQNHIAARTLAPAPRQQSMI